VASSNLRDELRAIPGVADAAVDDVAGEPSDVRVRLRPDADPARVGIEIQRILASHGMRSRVAGRPAPFVDAPVGLPTPEPGLGPDSMPGAPSPPLDRVDDPDAPVPVGEFGPPPRAAEDDRPVLASLALEESAEQVVVTAVASNGMRFTRRAADTTDAALSAAVAAAVGALAEGRPQRLLWVSTETVDGSEVVTVVLEKVDGGRVAGAAVVRAGKAFAVARATFAALRG